MIKKSFISLAVSAALSAGSGSLFAAQTALSGDYTATQSTGVYLVNGDTSFDLTSESYPPFAAGSTITIEKGKTLRVIQTGKSQYGSPNGGILSHGTQIVGSGTVVLERDGHGPVLLGSTSITADTIQLIGRGGMSTVAAYNGASHMLDANGNGSISIFATNISKDDAGAGAGANAVWAETGGEVTIKNFRLLTLSTEQEDVENVDDAHAIRNAGGNITIDGGTSGTVVISSVHRGAISSTGSSAFTNISAKTIGITSAISNEFDSSSYKSAAVFVNQGQVVLDASESLSIAAVDKEDETKFVDAIHVDGNTVLKISAKEAEVSGTTLVDSGSTMNLTSAAATFNGDVKAESGTVALNGNMILNGTTSKIGTLTGKAQISVTEKTGTVAIAKNNTENLTVSANSKLNDNLGNDPSKLLGGENAIVKINGSNEGIVVTMDEGLVNGAYSGLVDENGTIQGEYNVNSVQDATLDLTVSIPLTITRALTNDVRKRLGDIRSAQGTHGVWARYDGGKMSDDSGEFDHKFNMVQIGIDTVPTPDSARFGVAFSYTQGDSDFGRGSSDMDAFTLAAYGTWIADNGLFADVIGRIATVKNDMTVQTIGDRYTGKTDNTVLSLSGELGWRYDVTSMFYVEPQAELTYTYIDGDKFKLGYADYKTDAADSLVGRAGFALGIKCPNNKGDAYVRVSAVHEFLGDSMVTASAGNTINTAEFDGKDTWVEYAIGASYNVTPNTYVWADIERTSGAVVDEDVRGTVGVRFSF